MDPQPVIQTLASAAYTVIVLLVPVLIRLLYPQCKAWLDAQTARAQAGLTADQLALAREAAALAVQAVEQMRKSGAIVDNQHAFDTAQAITQQWLQSRGILLDLTELRAAVESEVHALPRPVATPASLANLPAGQKWE